MDNFEKNELSSLRTSNENGIESFYEFEMNSNEEAENVLDFERSDKVKTIVVCFPRTRIEAVEVYLRSRNINNYDTIFNIDELCSAFDAGHLFNLLVFDFVCESKLLDIIRYYAEKITEITVFTDVSQIAEQFSEITDKVYLVSQLIDILSLFWDSDVFTYDNVVKANENGIELVNKRALEIQGKKLDRLDLSLSVEKDKPNKYSDSVSFINIEKKFQGKDIGKVNSESLFKRTLSNFLDKFKNEDVEDEEVEVQQELESKKISNLLSKMNNNIESTMSAFLLRQGIIDESIKNQIDSLKDLKQISGVFCEVDFAINKGLIDEEQSIQLVNDYYLMYCMQFDEVMNSVVLLDEFKFEGCVEYKCFCTRGMRRDINYFIIDPDNEYGKHKIEEMFNSFEYIYTKERYIMEKLRRMEVR